jgi:tetratricopeptide (TPR) repeat protein
MVSSNSVERHLKMIKFPFRKISTLFHTKMRQTHTFRDVLAMYDKGDFKDAYADLCSIMEVQSQWSKDGDVYTFWAELELRVNGDAAKAQELLNRGREVGCSEMGYYHNISGRVMWEKGEHEKAIQSFEQSIAEDPSVANLVILAWALSNVGDSRAMSIYDRILEKDPKNCRVHISLGLQAAKSGDWEKAHIMAEKAEQLRSTAQDASEIGGLYHELEEFQSAINAYLEAEKLGYEKKGLLYAAVADCYSSLGQKAPARKYAQRAIRQDPENDYVKDVWREYQEKFGEAQ